jgi:hypothetical protein
MSYVEQHEVVDTGYARTDTRVATSRLVVSPGQVLAGVLGLVTAIVGVITLARGGIDSSLNAPIVRAAGFDQSALLGAIELALGLLLILGATSYAARGVIMFVGVIMVLGGVLLGAAGPTILRDVGTVHGTGWALMVGGIVALVASTMGRIIHTRRSVKTT